MENNYNNYNNGCNNGNNYNNGYNYSNGNNYNNGSDCNNGGNNNQIKPVGKNKAPLIILAVISAVVIIGIITAVIIISVKKNKPVYVPSEITTVVEEESQTTGEKESDIPETSSAPANNKPVVPPSPSKNNPDNSKEILSSNQYDLNIFLSNFTECRMGNFTGVPGDEELVDYAFRYYYLNTRNDYNYLKRTDQSEAYTYNSNYKISDYDMHRNISKYFNTSKKYGFFSGKETVFCKGYADGNFYFSCEQCLPDGFAVVKNVEASGNTYYCNFDIYSSPSEFPSVSANKPYYGLNAEAVNAYVKSGVLVSEGSGTAQITADNINDRSTYKLTGYNVNYF